MKFLPWDRPERRFVAEERARKEHVTEALVAVAEAARAVCTGEAEDMGALAAQLSILDAVSDGYWEWLYPAVERLNGRDAKAVSP